jgi:hypothetical protein
MTDAEKRTLITAAYASIDESHEKLAMVRAEGIVIGLEQRGWHWHIDDALRDLKNSRVKLDAALEEISKESTSG